MSIPQERPMICTFTSDDPNVADKVISFRREQGKKSAYTLDLPPTDELSSSSPSSTRPRCHAIKAPAHCYIQRADDADDTDQIFFLGGFRLTSNSRTVEVYLDDGKHKTDTDGNTNDNNNLVYLTTTRGIPYKAPHEQEEKDNNTPPEKSDNHKNHNIKTNTSNLYQIVCAIPGGARPIRRLALKLLHDLKPPEADPTVRIISLLLTARLPEATVASSVATSSSRQTTSFSAALFGLAPQLQRTTMASNNPTFVAAAATTTSQQQHQTTFQTPTIFSTTTTTASANSTPSTTPLSSDDLGAAMAGISFLIRSAQQDICDKINDKSSTKQQQSLLLATTAIQKELQQLTCIVARQQETLQQQAALLQQQTTLLQQQAIQLESLRQEVCNNNKNNTVATYPSDDPLLPSPKNDELSSCGKQEEMPTTTTTITTLVVQDDDNNSSVIESDSDSSSNDNTPSV